MNSERRTGPDDPSYPAGQAPRCATLARLDGMVASCRACPRLVAWREHVARTKKPAFQDWDYWGRPVPGFGPSNASMMVVGLAPAANGGNRTGRIFTGDNAGDALYAALHAVGLAAQPTVSHRDDGQQLYGVRITVPVHCAPPENKPNPRERETCRPWLSREIDLLGPALRAAVVLGAFAWQCLWPILDQAGWIAPRPRPRFGHGVHVRLMHSSGERELHLVGCFHPSQRNLFTGRLTPQMLREQLRIAAALAGIEPSNRS